VIPNTRTATHEVISRTGQSVPKLRKERSGSSRRPPEIFVLAVYRMK
jgi:hypothetical protein